MKSIVNENCLNWGMYCLIFPPFCFLLGNFSCLPGDCADYLNVQGVVFDGASETPLVGAFLGRRAFTAGLETDFIAAVISDGGPNGPPSDENGRFLLPFWTGLGRCQPFPDFRFPDLV